MLKISVESRYYKKTTGRNLKSHKSKNKKMKMKKLTTIFVALLFSCLIITSCSSDNKNEKDNTKTNNTTSNKISEEEKNIIALAQKTCELCNIYLESYRAEESDNFELQIELENKIYKGHDDLGNIDSVYKISAKNKDQQNLDKDFKLFKKELIKCKDSLEAFTGWEDMLESWKSSTFSLEAYDEKDEEYAIEDEDEYVVGQTLLADGYALGECECQLGLLEKSLENEYNEDVAMELEAVTEYCEELFIVLDNYYYEEDDIIRLEEMSMKYLEEECIVE